MERCCFAQLLKVVHSVSDRYFFALLWKAIGHTVVLNLSFVIFLSPRYRKQGTRFSY